MVVEKYDLFELLIKMSEWQLVSFAYPIIFSSL